MIKSVASVASPITEMKGRPRRPVVRAELSALAADLITQLISKHLEGNLTAQTALQVNLGALPAKDKKKANGSKSAASAASQKHKFAAVINSAASAASPMIKWASHDHL